MEKQPNFVISRQNLPGSFRFGALAAYWLLLTHFDAPTWAFYTFYVLAALVTIGTAVRIYNTQKVDLMARAEIRTSIVGTVDYPSSPTTRKITLRADSINVERIGPDLMRVSLRDATGNEIFRFRDYEVGPGTVLNLRGIRVETDVTFD